MSFCLHVKKLFVIYCRERTTKVIHLMSNPLLLCYNKKVQTMGVDDATF